MGAMRVLLVAVGLVGLTLLVSRVCGTGPTAGKKDTMETATFGAGCFWGVESAFEHLDVSADRDRHIGRGK